MGVVKSSETKCDYTILCRLIATVVNRHDPKEKNLMDTDNNNRTSMADFYIK